MFCTSKEKIVSNGNDFFFSTVQNIPYVYETGSFFKFLWVSVKNLRRVIIKQLLEYNDPSSHMVCFVGRSKNRVYNSNDFWFRPYKTYHMSTETHFWHDCSNILRKSNDGSFKNRCLNIGTRRYIRYTFNVKSKTVLKRRTLLQGPRYQILQELYLKITE